ncbi:hypothetical protein SNEBB_002315 [Seison nebaliae]|nr:hypothetical protein SNEBB_002315 [Seison nebaliae]
MALSVNLSSSEISRYSRQILLSEVGIDGQTKLKNSRVLIIGCGGLGCPSALYLCGAGIGIVGLWDHDIVDVNNLHRQIGHEEGKVNQLKVDSLKEKLLKLNSTIQIETYSLPFGKDEKQNEILRKYDIVLDCTDNVATRYLLNDLCVKFDRILISGSAIRMEGQLSIFNYSRKFLNITDDVTSYEGNNNLCYRCLWPVPSPKQSIKSCSSSGVLGMVPGTIGTLQATETIKVLLKFPPENLLCGKLLIYDAKNLIMKVIKLRGKDPNCKSCSLRQFPPSMTLDDYEKIYGGLIQCDSKLELLSKDDRLNCDQFNEMIKKQKKILLIDTREKCELELGKIQETDQLHQFHYSLSDMQTDKQCHLKKLEKFLGEKVEIFEFIVCVCRRGNNSQEAVDILQSICLNNESKMKIKDLIGGLMEWRLKYDLTIPEY